MSLSRRLADKPEILFRPGILARRLWFPILRSVAPQRTVMLPWQAPLRISLREVIGRSVYVLGLYELPVSETLWRLADPGDTVLDIGTNIGHMTSVLARRVGPKGWVHSFEPHPVVGARLQSNIDLWQQRLGWKHIQFHKVALTDHTGEAALFDGAEFGTNQGTASLEAPNSTNAAAEGRHMVACRRLDELIDDKTRPFPTVAKMDVEGHELKVLQGADKLLERGIPRDILFEDHNPFPTPVTQFLADRGYALFHIERDTYSPRVEIPHPGMKSRIRWEAGTFVATRDPQRFLLRMTRGGWRVLSKSVRRGENVEAD